jgi:hypothetical protein
VVRFVVRVVCLKRSRHEAVFSPEGGVRPPYGVQLNQQHCLHGTAVMNPSLAASGAELISSLILLSKPQHQPMGPLHCSCEAGQPCLMGQSVWPVCAQPGVDIAIEVQSGDYVYRLRNTHQQLRGRQRPCWRQKGAGPWGHGQHSCAGRCLQHTHNEVLTTDHAHVRSVFAAGPEHL